jgi:diguanylate cyclase (GGDEF)-like protein
MPMGNEEEGELGGRVIRRAVRNKATARAAVVGLTLGVFALAALAAISISSNAQTTRHVREAAVASDQWSEVTLNVSIEYEALTDYLRAESAIGRQPLQSSLGSATGNLAWLTADGDATDVEQALQVSEAYVAYTQTLRELIVADWQSDDASVEALSQQAALAASVLRKAAIANVTRKRLEMDQYLTSVDERNQQLVVGGGVIFGLDFLLLTLCALLLLSHQRRTERQAVENQHRAMHDELTGLANRALLTERIEETLRLADRKQEAVGLLLLDLNKFKDINDTLGHHSGDLLLQEVAARLSTAVRTQDLVARLGGDEFAVLLPDVEEPADCLEIARRLLETLQGPADLDGIQVDISGSIGAAAYPSSSSTAAELLQHADIAMYAAKRARSGAALYDAQADHRSSQQLGIIGELRRAIDEDELVLHYQPKVATSDGRVVGVEALVRWQHPTRGLLFPDAFIPQAEESEVIVALTDAVLDVALRQHREWREAGTVLPVAVNVATAGLHDDSFPDRVAAALAAHDVPAEVLTLEITETSIITDPDRVQTTLMRLRDLGVRLSVDDFGTGYSSMAYLQSMPLTELKIDRSFVRAVHESSSDEAIVRAIIELARALKLEVVAEGVENEQALAVLEALGCPLAQGYHMSRPVPADDLIPLLSRPLIPARV